ncbi:MAG: hypothetical protein R6V58_17145, partial [Planctomycetota bacterium]
MERVLDLIVCSLGFLLAVPSSAPAQTIELDGKSFSVAKQVRARQYDLRFEFKPSPIPAGGLAAIFARTSKGHYELALRPRALEIRAVSGDQRSRILSAPHRVEELRTLRIRRLNDLLVVELNGEVAARAIDTSFDRGYALVQVGKGVPAAAKVELANRGPIFFSDDFMVTEEEAKKERGWRTLAGRWECESIRPEGKAEEESYFTRSANPFAYLGKARSRGSFAVAQTGKDWWSGYSLRASIKCAGEGGAGIAFGCAGEKDFWLVRLECRRRFAVPSPLRLIRIRGGKRELVAERYVRARHGHWYSLSTHVYHGRVRVHFLGDLVMDV